MKWSNIFNDNIELTEAELSVMKALYSDNYDFFIEMSEFNPILFVSFLDNIPARFAYIAKNVISFNNIKLFQSSSNELMRDIAFNFFMNSTNEITGILNIDEHKITLDNKTINVSMNDKMVSYEKELIGMIKIAEELNMNEVPIIVELSESPTIKKPMKNGFINAGILASTLLFSLSSFGMDDQEHKVYDTEDAVSKTLKAVQKVPEVKAMIDENKEIIEKKAKEFVNEIEHKEIAGALGFATKVAIEQKIGHKGRLPASSLGLGELGLGKLDYSVELKLNGNIKGSIGGKNPFINNSTYEVIAESGKETRFKLDLKIPFD